MRALRHSGVWHRVKISLGWVAICLSIPMSGLSIYAYIVDAKWEAVDRKWERDDRAHGARIEAALARIEEELRRRRQ